jgi:hypothetical protein
MFDTMTVTKAVAAFFPCSWSSFWASGRLRRSFMSAATATEQAYVIDTGG